MTTLTSPQAKKQLPDGPKTPAFLQTIQALLDQFGLLERTQKKYGEIFYTPKSLGFPPFAIFSNPQAIEKVFTANPELFEVGQRNFFTNKDFI